MLQLRVYIIPFLFCFKCKRLHEHMYICAYIHLSEQTESVWYIPSGIVYNIGVFKHARRYTQTEKTLDKRGKIWYNIIG